MSVKNGFPVPVEFAAKNTDNQWTLHFALVRGIDLHKDQVIVLNPYGYEETYSIDNFVKATRYECYENMEWYFTAGFNMGLFNKNTIYILSSKWGRVMKQAAIITLAWLSITASNSVYSAETERRFSFQTNPVYSICDVMYPFLDNEDQTNVFVFDLEFQYSVTKNISFSLNNKVTYEKYLTSYYQDSNGRFNMHFTQQCEYVAEPAFIYRLHGAYLKGFYVSGFSRIGFSHVSSNKLNDSFTVLGGGILSGYQWVTKHGFTIQLGAGIGRSWIVPFRNNVSVYDSRNEWRLFNLPFDIPLILQLGYSFWDVRKIPS
jgi:hypothetical protein